MTPTNNWRETFDEKFCINGDIKDDNGSPMQFADDIKSFISQTLQQELSLLEREVEGMKENEYEDHACSGHCYLVAINETVDKVLTLLRQPRGEEK